jgi:toxin ParE1/3/4
VKPIVRRSFGARRDLIDIVRYLGREAGPGTARRFLAQAENAFGQLAEMPGQGARFAPEIPAMADLRFFPVPRFKKYLVFYRSVEGGIEVLRVLHGARDIPSLLAAAFGGGLDDDEE